MKPYLLSMLLCLPISQGTLHPTLAPDAAALAKVWNTGYQRAKHEEYLSNALSRAQRGLGRSRGESLGLLTFLHPRVLAFQSGFNANKDKLSEAAQREARDRLSEIAQEATRRLHFQAELNARPYSENGVEASLMDDVRVELQVGERIYAPVRQPGDVPMQSRQGSHDYDYCYYDSVSREWKKVVVHEPYTWYQGEFEVVFELYDADGNPRITDKDRELILFITGNFGRRKATFRLADWQNAYEK